MRLKGIEIKRFAGIREAQIDLSRPVTMFIGRNAQGKSSIRDAIAFALTGMARGITKAKDHGLLANDGGKAMEVTLTYEDQGDDCITRRDAKGGFKGTLDNPLLPYCLEPLRFMGLAAKERAAILTAALGSQEDVVQAVLARHLPNIDDDIAMEIRSSGIDRLNVEQLREKGFVTCRRVYKRELGQIPSAEAGPKPESYDLPAEFDAGAAEERLAGLEKRIEKGQQMVGARQAALQRQAEAVAVQQQIDELQSQRQPVGKGVDFDEIVEKLGQVDVLLKLLEQAQQTSLCPVCGKAGVPVEFVKVGNELAAWAEKYRATVERVQRAEAANARIDTQIDGLVARLEALRSQEPASLPAGSQDKLAELQRQRDHLQTQMQAYRRFCEDLGRFQAGQQRAERLRQLIAECDEAVELLRDGGVIQSEIAAAGRALPIHESLKEAWGVADFEIHDNGEILLHGRPIELASTSEQYRVAGLVALALAQIGGVGFAALDGFEVLTSRLRNRFLAAIEDAGVANVLVFCSTENGLAPAGLPDWLAVYGVRDGRVERLGAEALDTREQPGPAGRSPVRRRRIAGATTWQPPRSGGAGLLNPNQGRL